MMKAIILCAGKGERMFPLTRDLPKPMLPIAGKPCLEHTIELCQKHGIKNIGLDVLYSAEKIKDYFGNGSNFGVNIHYVLDKDLLGTAGALNNFRDFLDEPFFIIYGDNLTNLNLSKMAKFHIKKKSLATLYLYHEKTIDAQTGSGYVLIDNQRRVVEVIEKPGDSERRALDQQPIQNKFINAGLYLLSPEILSHISPGYSDFPKNIFPKLLKESLSVNAFISQCYFKEIGQISRYQEACKTFTTINL